MVFKDFLFFIITESVLQTYSKSATLFALKKRQQLSWLKTDRKYTKSLSVTYFFFKIEIDTLSSKQNYSIKSINNDKKSPKSDYIYKKVKTLISAT